MWVTCSFTFAIGVTNRDDDKAAGEPSLYSVFFTSSDKLRVGQATFHCSAMLSFKKTILCVTVYPCLAAITRRRCIKR